MHFFIDKKNQPGFVALSTVLIMGVVVVGIVLGAVLVGVQEDQSSYTLYQGESTLRLSESCLEDALIKARTSASYSGGTITHPEGSCVVNVVKAGSVWTITSSSTLANFSRALQAVINRGSSISITSWKEI